MSRDDDAAAAAASSSSNPGRPACRLAHPSSGLPARIRLAPMSPSGPREPDHVVSFEGAGQHDGRVDARRTTRRRRRQVHPQPQPQRRRRQRRPDRPSERASGRLGRLVALVVQSPARKTPCTRDCLMCCLSSRTSRQAAGPSLTAIRAPQRRAAWPVEGHVPVRCGGRPMMCVQGRCRYR